MRSPVKFIRVLIHDGSSKGKLDQEETATRSSVHKEALCMGG